MHIHIDEVCVLTLCSAIIEHVAAGALGKPPPRGACVPDPTGQVHGLRAAGGSHSPWLLS